MGNAGAQWIHIEVLASRWADTRSIDEMIGAGGFLMALTDQQQADMFNRVMGALPGEFSDSQRGPGGSGDGLRRFALDDQDGNYIVTLLERIAAKLGA